MRDYFTYKRDYRKEQKKARIFTIGLIALIIATLTTAIAGAVIDNANAHIVEDGGVREPVETIETVYVPVYVYYDYYMNVPQNEVKIPVSVACSEDELELLIRVIYLEAGAESDLCIRCCADVAFNQLQSGLFGNTLTEVLYRPNNYDETVWNAWATEPSDRVREIVMDVYNNGISLPARIVYYRNYYFHTFQYSVPEFTTDNVYFSSSTWIQ